MERTPMNRSKPEIFDPGPYWVAAWLLLPPILSLVNYKIRIVPAAYDYHEIVETAFPRIRETAILVASRHGDESALHYTSISTDIIFFFSIVTALIIGFNLLIPMRLAIQRDFSVLARRELGIVFLVFGLCGFFLTRGAITTRAHAGEHFIGSAISYSMFFKEYVFTLGVFFFSGMGILLILSYWFRSDVR